MTTEEKVIDFAQDVYLVRFERHIDDVDQEDGQEEVDKIIRWTNLFGQDLELETDWQWLRENDKELGTVTSSAPVLELPSDARKLAVDEHRSLVIKQGGSIVSYWDVVDPSRIMRDNTATRENRVTTVNRKIVFSRELNDKEVGGTVHADVIKPIPQLARDDDELLDLVPNRQLLVLGVAAHSTLPDITQGPLSPAYMERYADLLERAVAENEATSISNQAMGTDYSYIRGVF